MFSIWIGGRPGPKELECMAANDAAHGLTLIASQNWIGASAFLPIDTVIGEALGDHRVRKLWDAFPEPAYRSDALRLWYLIRNPSEVYVDSDCILHATNPPPLAGVPLLPSIQSQMERLAAAFGGEPDMDEIQNSTGEWLDVWAIVGAGDAAFFSAWLDLWVKDFFRQGGLSEAVSHGPFNVGILPTACFTHFSTRKTTFRAGPILDD